MTIDIDDVPDPADRYEVGDILGSGVYGKVYLAADVQASKKKVAIKMQKYEDETKEYVEEEYRILRDLSSHENIVDFYGIYRKGNEIWFVMEVCQAGPVLDLVNGLLAKNRRMAEEHIAYILKETVKALIYLHENNVIHRDVKGSNILLTLEGEVKLCDFGLSQKTEENDQRLSARLGSACWMAPELVRANPTKENANYDNRVDVWAIGITAIELGEGKVPFQDMHPTRALFQIIANPPPTLHKLSYWSENYHDFISECLVKYFEYRPYIIEILEHPFFEQIPENYHHLSLEIKSILLEIKTDAANRHIETNINGKFFKKGVDGNMEPMYEEDLATLQSMTENHVLMLLETRLAMGESYSFIGDILLYLNPNGKQDAYGKEFHRKYQFKSRSENAPHIYSVGDTAYQNALHHVVPQQIVLSGESGSGKTTNYLHLLDHLFFLGESPIISSARIKNAVKLIHALIHASTPSNDYSTRAVFKTHISYGRNGKLSGASFKVHCLEKWRVSSMDMSQSNYHVLYYIYDGLVSTNSAEEFKLNSNREYRYLKAEEETKYSQPKNNIKTNIIKYRKIIKYLHELEFSEEQVNTVQSVIAAILNLGEAHFVENDECLAELDNKEVIQYFSDLLEIENKKITWSLTNYCLVRGGNAIRKRNTCEEARDIRDVLANNLYTRLVDYIVNVINTKLSFGKAIFGEKYIVKILDYFGFECFKQNSLSQFMVNCLNEQLHYHYLQRIFCWELLDLQSEEVEYTPINFYNNKVTLNELLGKPDGVLSIIDDASKKGHNGRYVIGIIHEQEKSKVMITDALEFSVAHYTGTVSYNVKEIPEKNRDFLSPEVIETLRNSQNPIISMLFMNKLDRNGNLYIPGEEIKRSKYTFTSKISSNNQFSQIKKMRTQATIFRALCLDLLKELSVGSGSGGTHFVRCIRTDLKRRAHHFQKEVVRQQLRALAVLETAKARQKGYPHRISFSEFLRRYKFLAFDFDENVEINKDNCRLLMVRLKMEEWALGKTHIFLKYYNEEYLSRLYETQVKKIVKIQTILRGFLAKCRVAKEIKDQKKECIEELNKRRRSSDMTQDEAALIIQKAYRKSNQRKGVSDMFEPLQEEDCKFIKPFAFKWKNPSIFYVLMCYRASKLQDFFSFSQQVHLYNLTPFHITHQVLGGIDLKFIDKKATVPSWLGENRKTVLKLRFRLDEIPFYDTSHMCDRTGLGSFGKEDDWDTPYRWREIQVTESLKNNEIKVNLEGPRGIANIQYIRDPDEPIVNLPSPLEEIDEYTADESEIQNKYDTYDNIKSEIMNSNEGSIGLMKQGSSNYANEVPVGRNQARNVDSSDKIKAEKESYNMNTKPANKDFDYIKATPITSKSKHYVDPIAELRNIARSGNNISDDDPPFNFQGMLRKTNFRDSLKNVKRDSSDTARNTGSERRDSLKNAMQAMRRFSVTKDKEQTINVNGNNYTEEEPILSKSVSVEVLPGVFINGLEVEL